MIRDLRKTLKHTAIYGLGNISNKLVGLLLLPLYTDYLTTSEYGILSSIEISSQLLIVLFTINLPQAMLLWSATEKNIEKEKSIIFSTLMGIAFIAVIVVVGLFPFNKEFSLILFESDKFSVYFQLLLIWFFFGSLNKVPLSLIRLREKATFFSVLMFVKFLLILVLNIYFVAFANLGVEGIVYGQIAGEIFALILTAPMMLRNMKVRFELSVLKNMMIYGIPLAFTSISSLLLSSGDRYVMLYFLSSSVVGIYALAQKIGGVINVFLLNSFQQGFMPIAFKMFDQKNSKRFFSKVLTYYTLILASAALFLSLYSKEVIHLLTEKSYYESFAIVPFIAFAFVIKGINSVFTLGYHYSRKTGVYAVIIVSGMILNITANIFLIPWLEMYGAGISMLGSYIFMAVLSYMHSRKLYFVPYEIAKVLKILLLSVSLFLISVYLPNINFVIDILIKLILLISFPFLLYFLNFFEKVELENIERIWHNWRNPTKWPDIFDRNNR